MRHESSLIKRKNTIYVCVCVGGGGGGGSTPQFKYKKQTKKLHPHPLKKKKKNVKEMQTGQSKLVVGSLTYIICNVMDRKSECWLNVYHTTYSNEMKRISLKP